MEHDLVVVGKVVGLSGITQMEVGISGGRVAELKKQGLVGARRIEEERALIFPGFIDIHVHMREPGWERKEDFRTGSEAAIHGGVTTVADMPNNPTPTVGIKAIREKLELVAKKAKVDVKLYAGVSKDDLREIEKVASLVAGYKFYLAKTTGNLTFPTDLLETAFSLIAKTAKKVVSLHCEDQGIIDERARTLNDGLRPDAYSDLRPPTAEVKSVTRVQAALGGYTALRANVCHASAEGTLAIVRTARAQGLRMDCEAALHHLYFERSAMLENRLLRMNPPLRQESDRAALVKGLGDGTVTFLVTDHAPHLREEKLKEGLSGVPGLDDFGHVVSWLVKEVGIDPSVIARVASSNPASFLGLEDRGRIATGMRADLSIVDMSSPEVVKETSIRSKCGWSPYEGKEFPGRTKWTIRLGEPVLSNFELTV